MLRGGFMVLLAGLTLFVALDYVLWRPVLGELLAIRGAALALLLPAAPAFFGRSPSERGQEWLLYAGAVALLALSAIAWVVFPALGDGRGHAALLALNVFLAGLYGASGLRFRYAAGLGLAASALFCAGLLVRAAPTPALLLALGTFGLGANVVGLVLSRSLEQSSRRAYLRALELTKARARSEALLLNVMPRAWAERLGTQASRLDRVPDAAVLFATVTGYEEAVAALPPLAAVELLDALSLAMVGAVDALAAERGLSVRLRVGLATGPAVVGVIGRSRYAFDCWGDTVNTAARLDQAGSPGRVLTTAAAAERMAAVGRITPRGPTELKGKGVVATAWVDP